jgi:hypothetical protein
VSDADGEIIRSERRGRGQLSRRRGERETGKDENEDEDEDAERMMLKNDSARARGGIDDHAPTRARQERSSSRLASETQTSSTPIVHVHSSGRIGA